MLRILRHRTHLLDARAKADILDHIHQSLSSYDAWCDTQRRGPLGSLGDLSGLGLALEFAPAMRASFEEQVMHMLVQTPERIDPRQILGIVSMLVTNWRTV